MNEFVSDEPDDVEILRVDPESERRAGRAAEGSSRPTATRSWWRSGSRSCATSPAARGNLLEPIRAALKEHATIGEVCGVMREEFGEYKEA